MCGVRADGEIANTATLNLVHFQPRPAHGLILNVKGDSSKLTAGPSGLVGEINSRNSELVVEFETPIIAGQAIQLELQVSDRLESGAVFFNHAEWQF